MTAAPSPLLGPGERTLASSSSRPRSQAPDSPTLLRRTPLPRVHQEQSHTGVLDTLDVRHVAAIPQSRAITPTSKPLPAIGGPASRHTHPAIYKDAAQRAIELAEPGNPEGAFEVRLGK